MTKKDISTYLNIGNTPVKCLPKDDNGNQVILKLEYFNQVGHSAKARNASAMVTDFVEHHGKLKGKTIVESSSGNTVLALCELGNYFNFHVHAMVDSSISETKLQRLYEVGAIVEVLDPPHGCDSREYRIDRVKELARYDGEIWLNQYENMACVNAHKDTGTEILEQIGNDIDYIVGAIGTGSTICGISSVIKTAVPDVQIVAVEPSGSCIFGDEPTPKKTYLNFGAGNTRSFFWERNKKTIDLHYSVEDSDTKKTALDFYNKNGIPIGLSAAMSYHIISKIAEKVYNKTFVLIVADNLSNYYDLKAI